MIFQKALLIIQALDILIFYGLGEFKISRFGAPGLTIYDYGATFWPFI